MAKESHGDDGRGKGGRGRGEFFNLSSLPFPSLPLPSGKGRGGSLDFSQKALGGRKEVDMSLMHPLVDVT